MPLAGVSLILGGVVGGVGEGELCQEAGRQKELLGVLTGTRNSVTKDEVSEG